MSEPIQVHYYCISMIYTLTSRSKKRPYTWQGPPTKTIHLESLARSCNDYTMSKQVISGLTRGSSWSIQASIRLKNQKMIVKLGSRQAILKTRTKQSRLPSPRPTSDSLCHPHLEYFSIDYTCNIIGQSVMRLTVKKKY